MTGNDSLDLFKGTAMYYMRYRPTYPSSLIRFLINEFDLNGRGFLLDLGCGTGQLALRLADWFAQVAAVDAEKEMISEGYQLACDLQMDHIEWLHGKAENLPEHIDRLDLVTIGRAFHWMDREKVLEDLYHRMNPGGAVALIDLHNLKDASWQNLVEDVLQRWLGKERRAGNGYYEHSAVSHESLAKGSLFDKVTVHQMPVMKKVWTIQQLLGYLYSTSFASSRLFGDDRQAFEEDLKFSLLNLQPDGTFSESYTCSAIILKKIGE